jgi:hypothetical protein
MVDFSSRVYGTATPSRLNLLGYAGVDVQGAMLRWKAFGSIKLYIFKLYILGNITAPACSLGIEDMGSS